MKNVIITVVVTLFSLTIVQANKCSQVDSLASKNYQYFEEKVMEFRSDTVKALKMTKHWLEKANKENKHLFYQSILHII